MNRGAKARWIQWQRYRYQGLCAEGLEASIAYRIAAVEAKTRRKLARIIGGERARKAELEWHVSSDSVRFSLIGTIEGLTDKQVAALEEMNAITVK